jgi:hypothetical protein
MFERPEDMLDSTSTDGHRIRLTVEAALHGLQYAFMLPSPNPAKSLGEHRSFKGQRGQALGQSTRRLMSFSTVLNR